METIEHLRARDERKDRFVNVDRSQLSFPSSLDRLNAKIAELNPYGLSYEVLESSRNSWLQVFTACVEIDDALSSINPVLRVSVPPLDLKKIAHKKIDELNTLLTLMALPRQVHLPF